MITGIDLFGRPAVNKDERQMVDAARKTVADIFAKRHESPYKDELPEDVTIEEIEDSVLQGIVEHLEDCKRARKMMSEL